MSSLSIVNSFYFIYIFKTFFLPFFNSCFRLFFCFHQFFSSFLFVPSPFLFFLFFGGRGEINVNQDAIHLVLPQCLNLSEKRKSTVSANDRPTDRPLLTRGAKEWLICFGGFGLIWLRFLFSVFFQFLFQS